MILALLIGSIFGILFKYELNIYFAISYFIGLVIMFIFLKKKTFLNFISLIIFYFISSFNNVYQDDYFSGEVRVIEVRTNYYILKSKEYKFICYSDENFNLYQKLNVYGKTVQLENNTSKSYTTFYDYLHKKNINNSIEISSFDILTNGDTVRPFITNLLLSNLSDSSKEICSLLFLGNKSSSDLYDSLTNLSIVQLFVISGFHLNILASLLNKIFKKKKIYTIILLLPYCYLLNFNIPIMRAWLVMLANFVHEKKRKNVTKISVLFSIMLLFISFNYTAVFNLSFQLTFLTNIIILLLNEIKFKNKLLKKISVSFIIYISIFPLLISLNYKISLFGFLYSLFMSYPVTILYILCGITCILKVPDVITRYVYLIFKKIITYLDSINISLYFGRMKPYFIIVFYLLLIIFFCMSILQNKKKSLLSFLLIFSTLTFQYFYNEIFTVDKVVFMNVGQGDCTLIIGAHHKYVVMIDTGGSIYKDVATKYLVPYLRSNNIRQIDAVILTHDDYDHCGALESLKENINIKQVIEGYEIKNFSIKNFEIENINRYYSYGDDNEQSAVLYFKNGIYNYLIMGDAPIDVEKKIIKDFGYKIDILRIGHHGSKTSTCDEFIKFINPKYAIISVGFNYYGHPSDEVLKILKNNNIKYFRTDESYNICFKGKHIIEKY